MHLGIKFKKMLGFAFLESHVLLRIFTNFFHMYFVKIGWEMTTLWPKTFHEKRLRNAPAAPQKSVFTRLLQRCAQSELVQSSKSRKFQFVPIRNIVMKENFLWNKIWVWPMISTHNCHKEAMKISIFPTESCKQLAIAQESAVQSISEPNKSSYRSFLLISSPLTTTHHNTRNRIASQKKSENDLKFATKHGSRVIQQNTLGNSNRCKLKCKNASHTSTLIN